MGIGTLYDFLFNVGRSKKRVFFTFSRYENTQYTVKKKGKKSKQKLKTKVKHTER